MKTWWGDRVGELRRKRNEVFPRRGYEECEMGYVIEHIDEHDERMTAQAKVIAELMERIAHLEDQIGRMKQARPIFNTGLDDAPTGG